MGNSINRGDKDYDAYQKLQQKYKRLQRRYSKLRKQIERTSMERFDQLREQLEAYEYEDQKNIIENKDKTKPCWECGEGFLRLHVWEIRGGTKYFRKCDNKNCKNRTTMQTYTNNVKGVPYEDNRACKSEDKGKGGIK